MHHSSTVRFESGADISSRLPKVKGHSCAAGATHVTGILGSMMCPVGMPGTLVHAGELKERKLHG